MPTYQGTCRACYRDMRVFHDERGRKRLPCPVCERRVLVEEI